MNNKDVQALLADCDADLTKVSAVYNVFGATNAIAPFLTKYALIRACGTIEVAFKMIVADFGAKRSKAQIKQFLTMTVRNNSRNPTYSNICSLLGYFDEGWRKQFKVRVDARGDKAAVLLALQSLVDSRNEFAHGGSPTITLNDVLTYFAQTRQIMEDLDAVVC